MSISLALNTQYTASRQSVWSQILNLVLVCNGDVFKERL